jgi:hypothetical protein
MFVLLGKDAALVLDGMGRSLLAAPDCFSTPICASERGLVARWPRQGTQTTKNHQSPAKKTLQKLCISACIVRISPYGSFLLHSDTLRTPCPPAFRPIPSKSAHSGCVCLFGANPMCFFHCPIGSGAFGGPFGHCRPGNSIILGNLRRPPMHVATGQIWRTTTERTLYGVPRHP